jgi:hypothetical protein
LPRAQSQNVSRVVPTRSWNPATPVQHRATPGPICFKQNCLIVIDAPQHQSLQACSIPGWVQYFPGPRGQVPALPYLAPARCLHNGRSFKRITTFLNPSLPPGMGAKFLCGAHASPAWGALYLDRSPREVLGAAPHDSSPPEARVQIQSREVFSWKERRRTIRNT